MTRHLAAITGASALLAAAAAGAESRVVTADPEATRVTFTLGATLHEVAGSARLLNGRVVFDPATGAADGGFVVDATSLETGNEKRDRDMHRKVLESATYPEIAFVAEGISGELPAAGEFELEVSGRLEIHGGSHPVTLPIEGTLEGETVRATIAFEVPYVAWGMNDPSKLLLRVAKVVEVAIEMTAELGAASAPEPQ